MLMTWTLKFYSRKASQINAGWQYLRVSQGLSWVLFFLKCFLILYSIIRSFTLLKCRQILQPKLQSGNDLFKLCIATVIYKSITVLSSSPDQDWVSEVLLVLLSDAVTGTVFCFPCLFCAYFSFKAYLWDKQANRLSPGVQSSIN